MAQRKCSQCGHWNINLDYCEKCNNLINLELQTKLEHDQKWRERLEREPDQLDKAVDSIRYSKWWVLRVIYWIGHSIWVLLISILSFFMYMIAWGPG